MEADETCKNGKVEQGDLALKRMVPLRQKIGSGARVRVSDMQPCFEQNSPRNAHAHSVREIP